jgi:hypothetical protein
MKKDGLRAAFLVSPHPLGVLDGNSVSDGKTIYGDKIIL